ncbi:hypothetical protein CXF85_05200 [Colwellia sp. 75C3]|uniref:hypothetical protein n=1 Tax=Colwellia sp. 75C3 TaxID=888425 RepID=UPI000C341CA0|nr:hypothetical protein [Colwellia sp. 75C3]PKG85009.1 hypothetical protein CXF85_05200 [Colwellia sp. 75C3]
MTNRTKFCYYAVVTSLLISQTVLAKEAELDDKIKVCSEISQDAARLLCFDQLIDVSNSKLAPQITALTAAQVDEFSKVHVKKTDKEIAEEINSITLTISTLSKTIRGQWKLTFKNGQKWQQKDTTKLRLNEGDLVVLTKGALGAVYLQKKNTNKRIKVKRLK